MCSRRFRLVVVVGLGGTLRRCSSSPLFAFQSPPAAFLKHSTTSNNNNNKEKAQLLVFKSTTIQQQEQELYWLDDYNDNNNNNNQGNNNNNNNNGYYSSYSSSLNGFDYFDGDDDDDLLFGGNDDNDDDDIDRSDESVLGKSIGQGKVVMCLPNIASPEECECLFEAAMAAAREQTATSSSSSSSTGRFRFSVADPAVFSPDIVMLVEEILLRVMDHVDEHVPSVYDWLFLPSLEWPSRQPLDAQLEQPRVPPDAYLAETCTGLRDLYTMGALEWSEGEPAMNVYQPPGGYFGPHKDHLALTILVPLTNNFHGGGTGFWAGNRNVDEHPQQQPQPSYVSKPTAGSALLFGGDVTHCGMPVESGIRSVLVCSFSTKTPVSLEDRLHGLQAPPKVSANFKGTI